MSEEIIRYAELRFAQVDASLDRIREALSETDNSLERVEIGVAKLKAQQIELSTGLDRIELGLGRFLQRFHVATPVEPSPSTTA